MKSRHLIHRRTALKTAAASLMLPLLDQERSAMADLRTEAAAAPKRIVYLYFPNGAAEGSWKPKKIGRQGELLKLNKWMSPLEPFQKRPSDSQQSLDVRRRGTLGRTTQLVDVCWLR